MTRPAPDPGAPFLDLADPAFSLRSAQVRRARAASWYARTSYGLAVLRHDQVARLIRHPDLRQGSVAWPAHHGITSGPFADWWAGWVLNKEGDDHRRLRRLLNPAFSRRLVESLRPRFLALAGELADGFAGAGRCEFMADFAEPYAARVIAILLGIPRTSGGWSRPTRRPSAWPWECGSARTCRGSRRRWPGFTGTPTGSSPSAAPARGTTSSPAWSEAQPEQDRLTAAELRDSLVLLIFGGFDTTRNQLGLAMQAFIENPAQWRLLAERPGPRPGRGGGGHAAAAHDDLGHPGGAS